MGSVITEIVRETIQELIEITKNLWLKRKLMNGCPESTNLKKMASKATILLLVEAIWKTGALATGLAASQFSSKSTEWLRRLPEVASALNREETRFAGKKPVDAIREKAVSAKAINNDFSRFDIDALKSKDSENQVRHLSARSLKMGIGHHWYKIRTLEIVRLG
ncbi:hypothetical protein pdam_00001493 [Pocillopora damicornis]|uniref:Uncharacterized protein n=1 Tax=Pocillopora damicornis TaxID=46731 RepID=A0A3M6U5F1_POCDA|nr:hypothetical protein pdam_00001493 [Pocillopora damicornis]